MNVFFYRRQMMEAYLWAFPKCFPFSWTFFVQHFSKEEEGNQTTEHCHEEAERQLSLKINTALPIWWFYQTSFIIFIYVLIVNTTMRTFYYTQKFKLNLSKFLQGCLFEGIMVECRAVRAENDRHVDNICTADWETFFRMECWGYLNSSVRKYRITGSLSSSQSFSIHRQSEWYDIERNLSVPLAPKMFSCCQRQGWWCHQ